MGRQKAFVSRLAGVFMVYALLCGGCTPNLAWVKTGMEPGSADQQQAACTLQAETTYISSEESAEARSGRVARWTSLCMRANGWHQQEVAAQ